MTATKQVKLTKAQATAYAKADNKSARIRYLLTHTKWSNRQVADHVGVIYQFVWNVGNKLVK